MKNLVIFGFKSIKPAPLYLKISWGTFMVYLDNEPVIGYVTLTLIGLNRRRPVLINENFVFQITKLFHQSSRFTLWNSFLSGLQVISRSRLTFSFRTWWTKITSFFAMVNHCSMRGAKPWRLPHFAVIFSGSVHANLGLWLCNLTQNFSLRQNKNQTKVDLFSFSVWVENKFLKFLIRLPWVSDIFGRQFSPVCVFFAFAYFIATNISYRINHFSSALKTFCNPFAFPITRSSLVPTEIRQMIKYQSLSVCVSWWRYILTCTGFTRLAGIGALLIHVNFVG